MRRNRWSAGLLVVACGCVHAAPATKADADILSACIGATVYKVAAYGVNQKDDVIYVSPEESAGAEHDRQFDIQRDLRGAHVEKVRALSNALRDRTGKGWRAPADLFVTGWRVKTEEPPWSGITLSDDGTASFQDAQHVSFWFYPPGYSADGKSAVAHALVGPTPHGATISCELSLRRGRWKVANSGFTSYP